MKRLLVITFAAMLLGSGFLEITKAQGGEFDRGKSLYNSKCMICHGANGKGDGPAAAALSPQPKDFARPEFWKGDVDKKIADTVRNGLGPMPAFSLSDDEIKAIIGYMSHTFK